jgi:hypothetical protein
MTSSPSLTIGSNARANVSDRLVEEFPIVISEGDVALTSFAVLLNPSSARFVEVTETE